MGRERHASSFAVRSSGALWIAASVFIGIVAPARAAPTVEQLQSQYDDALKQLQQSQDRKNQLANENEQLKSKLVEMELRLHDVEAAADPAYLVRARTAAWEAFVGSDAQLTARFNRFTSEGSIFSADSFEMTTLIACDWPFSTPPLPPPATTEPATTEPAGVPTTQRPPATSPATTQAGTPAPATTEAAR